ncbi:MAG: prepilin-type N-terminal cleavage/methylation domain-containing protein [Proteobacteria bacterium]|nr:MAG: prepilin-type N-terminal cleavage/methylation domain-containing protein [Pseudomonadota bacterium]
MRKICLGLNCSRALAASRHQPTLVRIHQGFTLLELIFVIVLAGVLAAVAGPRLFSSADLSARGFFDAAINSARYAQKLAVASGCNTRVQFTATGYALHQATTCGGLTFTRIVPDPADGAPFADTAPAGVIVTASEVYFDAAGRPRNPATGALLGVSTDVVIGGSRTLRIEPESGYAHQL